MTDRFVAFLLAARWTCAVVATAYHARFLLFVNYGALEEKSGFSKIFYFVTGLGHEAYAVFFILDGILAGLLLRLRALAGGDRPSVGRHLGSLYRILLPTLIIGASFDLAGAQFFNDGGLYTRYPEFSTLTLSYASLLGNLLMLQPFIVPNFGSNSMLYLLSYLFWSSMLLIFLDLCMRTAGTRKRRLTLAAFLLGAAIALLPYKFLIWAGIWLSGVAVVYLAESRRRRPPRLLAAAIFAGTLVLSRVYGMNKDGLPTVPADILAQAGFWLVGSGFALLAWAVYPQDTRAHPGALHRAARESAEGWVGQTASLSFFCHFPVIMLLAAISPTVLGLPLMQQPGPGSYAVFAGFIGACILTAAAAARAFPPLARTLVPARRNNLPETR